MASSGLSAFRLESWERWVGRLSFASRLGGEMCARSTDAERRRLSVGQQGECHERQRTLEALLVAKRRGIPGPKRGCSAGDPVRLCPIPPRGVVCRPRTKHLLQITTFGRWTLTPGAERLHRRLDPLPAERAGFARRVCDALPARPRQVPLGKKHIPEDPWKITKCRDHSFDEEKRFYVGRDMKIATR